MDVTISIVADYSGVNPVRAYLYIDGGAYRSALPSASEFWRGSYVTKPCALPTPDLPWNLAGSGDEWAITFSVGAK